MSRKREGYKELAGVYLTNEEYDLLDDYMRKNKHLKSIKQAAEELLRKALKQEMDG